MAIAFAVAVIGAKGMTTVPTGWRYLHHSHMRRGLWVQLIEHPIQLINACRHRLARHLAHSRVFQTGHILAASGLNIGNQLIDGFDGRHRLPRDSRDLVFDWRRLPMW
jgi:hypothetical protein